MVYVLTIAHYEPVHFFGGLNYCSCRLSAFTFFSTNDFLLPTRFLTLVSSPPEMDRGKHICFEIASPLSAFVSACWAQNWEP